jgi:hypothetical protein
MKRETQPNDDKRRYEKPELTQVALRAEEAVLGVCKSASSSSNGHPFCSDTPRCNSIGS